MCYAILLCPNSINRPFCNIVIITEFSEITFLLYIVTQERKPVKKNFFQVKSENR